MNATNHNIDWTLDECTYFLRFLVNNMSNNDYNIVKQTLADSLGRSVGSVNKHIKTALFFVTQGKQGLDNGAKAMAQAIQDYLDTDKVTTSKLILALDGDPVLQNKLIQEAK